MEARRKLNLQSAFPEEMIPSIQSPTFAEFKSSQSSFFLKKLNETSGWFSDGSVRKRNDSPVDSALRSKDSSQFLEHRKARGSMFCTDLWGDTQVQQLGRIKYKKSLHVQITKEKSRPSPQYRSDLDKYFLEKNPEFAQGSKLVKDFMDTGRINIPKSFNTSTDSCRLLTTDVSTAEATAKDRSVKTQKPVSNPATLQSAKHKQRLLPLKQNQTQSQKLRFILDALSEDHQLAPPEKPKKSQYLSPRQKIASHLLFPSPEKAAYQP